MGCLLLADGEPATSGFRDITDDEACVDELRTTFRFFASVLVRRAQKVTLENKQTVTPGLGPDQELSVRLSR